MNRIDILLHYFSGLFSSQDSRFYLHNGLRFVAVSFISISIVSYSLWTIMEMNFNFFVANGFFQDNELFYDVVFKNISEYLSYFSLLFISIFMLGLFTSYLALRAFDHIEYHAYYFLDDPEEDLKLNFINQNKLIYQVSNLFFQYLASRLDYTKKIRLPHQLEYLKAPKTDKLFLTQYTIIVGMICLASAMLSFSFSRELYQEILTVGLDLLPNSKIVGTFLDSQKNLLYNIFSIALIAQIAAYVFVAKKILKTVDGVSFGFAREMIKVMQGKHDSRLTPRRTDPGQGLALYVNELLDEVFPETVQQIKEKESQAASLAPAPPSTTDFTPRFDRLDELNIPQEYSTDEQHSTFERSESTVINMLLRGKLLSAPPKFENNSKKDKEDKEDKKDKDKAS